MPGALAGTTAAWSVVFSPSKSAPPAVNLHQTIADFLGPAGAGTEDVLLLIGRACRLWLDRPDPPNDIPATAKPLAQDITGARELAAAGASGP